MDDGFDTSGDVVDKLRRLGLSTYEARVFVALVKIGTATAREVSEVEDIPRPQVYGAADDLIERGLVSASHSRPKKYRSVSLEEAESQLARRLGRERTEAFEQLSAMQETAVVGEERNNVWTIVGTDPIRKRAAQLIQDAEERVVIGCEPATVKTTLLNAIETALESGTTVVHLHDDDAAIDWEPPINDGFHSIGLTDTRVENVPLGVIVIGDFETLLISVLSHGTEDEEGGRTEIAIWSEQSTLSHVLIQLIMASLPEGIDDKSD